MDDWIDDEKERRKTPFAFVFIPFDGEVRLVWREREACIRRVALAA